MPIASPLLFPEYVAVGDAYSYPVDVPFGDWTPAAGDHLFLVVGVLGGSDGAGGDAVALPSNAVSLVRGSEP